MIRALPLVLLLAACTQPGTGVEVTIDPAGLAPDRLDVTANYDGRHVLRTITAPGADLRFIAELPEKPTTVTFDVTAFAGGTEIGHGSSDPVAVQPRQIARTTVTLGGGTGSDGGAGDGGDGGAVVPWSNTHAAGTGTITGIWGASANDVYATCSGCPGANLFHSFDHGTNWIPQNVMGGVALNGVGGTSSSDVFLVGDNAVVLHGSNTIWSPQNTPAPAATKFNAVFALSSQDVYIAGSGNVILHSVTGGYVTQTAAVTTDLRSVWGIGGSLYAVGSGGTILHSTGNGTWSPQTSNTGAELRAVFGLSATDVWVAGDGVVLRSSGTTWAPADTGVPAGVFLRGLGGRPGGPLFAAGTSSTILRRDATAWVVELQNPAAEDLTSIWAASASEAFAGGGAQTLLHRQ